MNGTFLGFVRLHAGAIVILQGKQGQSGPVVEITAAQTRHEERHRAAHQHQADEDQNYDDIHVIRLSLNRQAVQPTTPTELSGMRIAATTGVTSPASARLTAARL